MAEASRLDIVKAQLRASQQMLDETAAQLASTQRMLDVCERQLASSRYVVHSLIVHKYAVGVVSGQITMGEATDLYSEAMRNYDQIVDAAAQGASVQANIEATARGASAIETMVEEFRRDAG